MVSHRIQFGIIVLSLKTLVCSLIGSSHTVKWTKVKQPIELVFGVELSHDGGFTVNHSLTIYTVLVVVMVPPKEQIRKYTLATEVKIYRKPSPVMVVET